VCYLIIQHRVYVAMVEWYWQGNTEVLGGKPVPVSLCTPQISHGLTWYRAQASAVTGRHQTVKAHTLNWNYVMEYKQHTHSQSKIPSYLLLTLLSEKQASAPIRKDAGCDSDKVWGLPHHWGSYMVNVSLSPPPNPHFVTLSSCYTITAHSINSLQISMEKIVLAAKTDSRYELLHGAKFTMSLPPHINLHHEQHLTDYCVTC
jgi:hypothetical protein